MQAGAACTKCHNHVADIVYRNICTEYGLNALQTLQEVVENNRAKILATVKAAVVPVEVGAHWAVIPKLEYWLEQILRTKSELPLQESTVLSTAKILCKTLQLPDLW